VSEGTTETQRGLYQIFTAICYLPIRQAGGLKDIYRDRRYAEGMKKKWFAVVGALALFVLVGAVVAGTVSAQAPTPTPAPNTFLGKLGRGLGFWGGPNSEFDAIAKALNLTPTQLFEQLHSGKTLEEIAQAQGVDLTKVQEAVNASRLQAMKDRIAQAVKDGKMTQEQADWLLQGLEKGYMPGGRGGRFGGFMDHGGMRGFGGKGFPKTPSTPTPGTSS